MHELTSAILDRDLDAVRRLLRQHPELRTLKTEAGFTIFELAQKTGSSLVEACVLREARSPIADPEATLSGILSTLSEEYFCAGWESAIEFNVWHCLQHEGRWPAELDELYTPLCAETLADLRYVVDQTGSWYLNDVGLLSVEAWVTHHYR